MRVTALSALALGLASAASGLDFKDDTLGDVEVTSEATRDLADWNRPAKRQSGWNPPSNLALPLREVWDHQRQTYNGGNVFGFRNYGWDQIMATGGYAINSLDRTGV